MDRVNLSWQDVYEQSVKLAALIKASGQRFDLMVVVPRGAYYPANIVSRELGFSATDLVQAAIGSYQGNQQGEFQLGQMPTAEQISGKRLLVIDEVCDTGRTLHFLADYLKKAGAKSVHTGVLHYKPAMSQVDFQPDWAVETTDQWIVYPWESHDQKMLQS